MNLMRARVCIARCEGYGELSMKLINTNSGMAVAIGFFDGVHSGHQAVILNAVSYARENGVKCVVITFDRSPKIALGQNISNDGFLTPDNERKRLFYTLGVDRVMVLPFDKMLQLMSASDFVHKYLISEKVRYVSVGFDFRFGHGGLGDVDYLREFVKDFEIDVTPQIVISGEKISSTRIRDFLKCGKLEQANMMLGRCFSISGEVVYGRQLGRTIQFPTANLRPDGDYFALYPGVYATITHVHGRAYASMTNVGNNPTFNFTHDISIETHILDFDVDIYDEKIRVEFVQMIRNEQKFDDIQELILQLKADADYVRTLDIGGYSQSSELKTI